MNYVAIMNSNQTTTIMDGTAFATDYAEKILKPRCSTFLSKYGKLPHLVTVLVGENSASESYIRLKEKYFSNLCLRSTVKRLSTDISENDLKTIICLLNEDSDVDGILVQLPLPKHINQDEIIETINPKKDVEGLSPVNVYNLTKGQPNIIPATALGVVALLKYYQVDMKGKHVVLLGRSRIVGKPVFELLLSENATITICHSHTKPLEYFTKQADILVTAIGKGRFITKEMVKEGVTIVDVGVSIENGSLVGDVDFDNVKEKVKLISPVPGGSGPVTVSVLTGNLLLTFELSKIDSEDEMKECIRNYYSNYEMIFSSKTC